MENKLRISGYKAIKCYDLKWCILFSKLIFTYFHFTVRNCVYEVHYDRNAWDLHSSLEKKFLESNRTKYSRHFQRQNRILFYRFLLNFHIFHVSMQFFKRCGHIQGNEIITYELIFIMHFLLIVHMHFSSLFHKKFRFN